MTLKEKKQRRAQLITECRQIVNGADSESRSLTTAEERTFNSKMDEVRRLALDIQEDEANFNAPQRSNYQSDSEYLAALEAHLSISPGRQSRDFLDYDVGNPSHDGNGNRNAVPAGTIYFETPDGRQVRSYRHGEPMAGAFQQDLPDGIRASELDLGRYLRGIITGDWSKAQAERRVMSTLDQTLGGYMVPGPLSGMLIDVARAQSVLSRAGARSVPMESKELTLAKMIEGPSVQWKAENAEADEDAATNFGAVTLYSKTCMAVVRSSIELIQDAPNFGSAIENALGQGLGLELDRAGLLGSGANNQPTGLYYDPDLGEIDLAGAHLGYDDLLDAIGEIENANGAASAWITSPSLKTWLSKWKNGEAQYILPPPEVAALRRFVSTQVPANLGAGSVLSAAFVGGFSNMILGSRQLIQIEVSREAGDVFKKFQVLIRATLRGDWVTTRPEQIVRVINAAYAE